MSLVVNGLNLCISEAEPQIYILHSELEVDSKSCDS